MTAAHLIYGLLGLCCVVTIGHLLERRWLKGQRFDQQAQVDREIEECITRISSRDFRQSLNDDARIHRIHHYARTFARASAPDDDISRN